MKAVAIAAAVLATALLGVAPRSPIAHAEGQTRHVAATHRTWNGFDLLPSSGSDAGPGANGVRNASNPVCSTPVSADSNVNTDCEGQAPHLEGTIAVNPTDPANLIASANDYQLTLSPGGTEYFSILDRVRVSIDHGASWTTVPIPQNSYNVLGDVAVAFDGDGTAYITTLGFMCSGGGPTGCETDPDVLVATSADKGNTWTMPDRVAAGSGVWWGRGGFNDKEYIAAWGQGNAIVTWTVFNQGQQGAYISSPIYDSVTHDAGRTWSAPQPISGSATFCTGAAGGDACDQDQFSVPAAAADGSVVVAFENTDRFDPGSTDWLQDQYLVVHVDPATGSPLAGPTQVAQLIDGAYDYPLNADGLSTYHDSGFRTNSAGNIAIDPGNPSHLALVWSDMRNSALPSTPSAYDADPFAVATNSDVVVSQTTDGGATWSAATALPADGDQFQPWGAYDSNGRLRIGSYDRSMDPANRQYGYSLYTETAPGSPAFTTAQLTTALSDPTRNDRWFSSGIVDNATAAIGDYSVIAAAPSGGVVAVWTDLRNAVCLAGRCGATEDIYFAASS